MTQFQNDFRTLRAFMPYKAANSISYSIDAIEAISAALHSFHEPMRCKEIAAFAATDHKDIVECADGKYRFMPHMSYQKITATLRKMLREGLVERVPMGTENVPMGEASRECEIYGYLMKR